jgi:hypothetical protein
VLPLLGRHRHNPRFGACSASRHTGRRQSGRTFVIAGRRPKGARNGTWPVPRAADRDERSQSVMLLSAGGTSGAYVHLLIDPRRGRARPLEVLRSESDREFDGIHRPGLLRARSPKCSADPVYGKTTVESSSRCRSGDLPRQGCQLRVAPGGMGHRPPVSRTIRGRCSCDGGVPPAIASSRERSAVQTGEACGGSPP